jgi:hypothetical protein
MHGGREGATGRRSEGEVGEVKVEEWVLTAAGKGGGGIKGQGEGLSRGGGGGKSERPREPGRRGSHGGVVLVHCEEDVGDSDHQVRGDVPQRREGPLRVELRARDTEVGEGGREGTGQRRDVVCRLYLYKQGQYRGLDPACARSCLYSILVQGRTPDRAQCTTGYKHPSPVHSPCTSTTLYKHPVQASYTCTLHRHLIEHAQYTVPACVALAYVAALYTPCCTV